MPYVITDRDVDCLHRIVRELRQDVNYRRYGMLKQRTSSLETILLNLKKIDDAQLRKDTK